MRFDHNLLYQTLLGYCLGLLTIITAISSERPSTKRWLPFLYLPLVALLSPEIYQRFPIFGEFRPMVWISVAYLAGVACMLHVAMYYRIRKRRVLVTALAFLLICVSGVFLFFPAAIGSPMWMHGHIFRPVGFLLLAASVNASILRCPGGGSILYKTLSAFTLLAALPLLTFGTFIFYEHINPIGIEGRRILIFLLMLASFASALIFGLGMIIRLIGPIFHLKCSVERLADSGFKNTIPVVSNDEIGELTTAFNQMVAKLDSAVEERERYSRLAATGELAATLAHEIKNPLNAIGGAAAYIKSNYQGRLIEEFVQIIKDEAARINNLTRALLGFAKPMRPAPRPNDIAAVVRDTVSLLAIDLKQQDIHLRLDLNAGIPAVMFDYNQIKQLLINLVINAMDATGDNGTITITAGHDGERLRVTVADNGPGIAADMLKQVFNPFFTTKTRGTGLGLAVSKKIAREHRGDLTVESEPGAGTVFTLILPGGSC